MAGIEYYGACENSWTCHFGEVPDGMQESTPELLGEPSHNFFYLPSTEEKPMEASTAQPHFTPQK